MYVLQITVYSNAHAHIFSQIEFGRMAVIHNNMDLLWIIYNSLHIL